MRVMNRCLLMAAVLFTPLMALAELEPGEPKLPPELPPSDNQQLRGGHHRWWPDWCRHWRFGHPWSRPLDWSSGRRGWWGLAWLSDRWGLMAQFLLDDALALGPFELPVQEELLGHGLEAL